ncbi:MAG: septum formation initiator family protein [Patescibacteria group bacterium]|nr:septum formation initiator family protein [Patescibacteria group bacterium]
MMQFRENKFISNFAKIASYLVIFWIIFLLGRSVWQNWNLKHSIWKLNEQIVILKKEKKDLENLNLYYSSDAFKELEARKRLGLKKPGEKMVILPVSPAGGPTSSPSGQAVTESDFPEEIKKEKESVAGVESLSKIPNWLLWWQYFTR